VLCDIQVQDETQKMNEWFERQEQGLSQQEGLSQGRAAGIMTTSSPGVSTTPRQPPVEKCNTLPFTRRKQQEDPRGRQADRRRGSLGDMLAHDILRQLTYQQTCC